MFFLGIITLLSACQFCYSYNIVVDIEKNPTVFEISQDERVISCGIDNYDETVFHLNPDSCSLLIFNQAGADDDGNTCCDVTVISQTASSSRVSVKFPFCVDNTIHNPIEKRHRVQVEISAVENENLTSFFDDMSSKCPSLLQPLGFCSCDIIFDEVQPKSHNSFHSVQSISGCSSTDFEVLPQFTDVNIYLNGHSNHRYHHRTDKVLRHRRSSFDVFFMDSQFTVKISEELPSGTVVTVMELHNNDGPIKSNVEYTMTPMKNRVSARKFNLDPSTGVVTTTVRLDREDMNSHSFTVYGSVTTSAGVRQDSCTLKIKVDDINDNKPEFEETNGYEAHIPEHSELGMQVGTVTALDPDLGDNSLISYSISNSVPHTDAFEINSDGDIFVSGLIDREVNSQYILTITAKDHGDPPFSSQSKMKIVVDDINDNTPQFTKSRYQYRVHETFQVGQIIANVSAVDKDSADNGRVTYYITYGNRAHKFALDPHTGEITLVSPLDYEQDHRGFHLTVEAVDHGRPPRRNSTGVVDINVVDVNDNKPYFINPPYQKFVKENFPSGVEILRVHAYDGDYGTQSVLTYSLVSPPKNLPFAVETLANGGGSVILRSGYVLDHEKVTKYQFQIRAQDRGRPPKSDVANVTVFVQDVNDNPPKFDQSTYNIRIKEDTLENEEIIKVNAVDPDEDSSLVSYQINRGNSDGHFRYANQYAY